MPVYTVTQNLLAQMGEKIGLDSLALDREGICSLIFDDKVVVNMECDEEGNKLILYALTGSLPKERGALFRGALEKNMELHESSDAAVGFDKEEDSLAVMDSLSVDELTYAIFEERLRKFVDLAESLMQAPPGSQEEDSAPKATSAQESLGEDSSSFLRI